MAAAEPRPWRWPATRAQADYTAWIEAVWADYSRNYLDFYGQVRRWPDSPFWQRRMNRS